MKRIVLLLTIIQLAIGAWAGDVTIEEAQQKAQDFMNRRHVGFQSKKLRLAQQPAATEQAERLDASKFYVFNYGTSEGFVIVSADDRTEAILGYTDSGTYDERTLPENMRRWLDDYTEQIRQLDVCGITQDMSSPYLAGRAAINPMLQTKWNQKDPYNRLCPTDPTTGKTSLVGCVAVTMAQVMNYFKYPAKTKTTIPAYTTKNAEISMPAYGITTIRWNDMLPWYDERATESQIDAVAQLSLLCGAAIQMDYGSSNSSAYMSEIADVLPRFFDYDGAMQCVGRIGRGINEWEDLIYNELRSGRPVFYRGTRDVNGTDGNHAFVIDGYDGNGFFHVNWGWGNYNGFFLLSVMAPYASSERDMLLSNEGYTISQEAIIGTQPNAGGSIPACMMARDMELTSASSVTRSSTSADFPEVTVTTAVYNHTGETKTWDVGIGLLNASGTLVATSTTRTNYTLNDNYGWKELKSSITFGNGLSNGTYRIVSISRESGNGRPWQIDKYATDYALYAKIQGKNMTIRATSTSLSGSISLEESAEVNKLTKLRLHIQNNGTDFKNVVYLFVDGERSGGRFVEIPMDGTKDVEIGFKPTSAGNHSLSIAYYYNDYVTFANLTVNAKAAATNSLGVSVVSTNATSDKKIGTTLEMTVSVTNKNTAYYNNKLRATLYKLRHDGSNYGDFAARQENDLYIAPGNTITTSFRFTDLEEGEYYFVWIEYYSNGEINSNKDDRTYGGGFTVSSTSGISRIEQGDEWINIYTIRGTLAGRCKRSQLTEKLNSLPKAVYVIEGKKVVRD